MKTNVKIDLTDEQRCLLANIIDGRETKRLASRDDIREMLVGFCYGVIGAGLQSESESMPPPKLDMDHATHGRRYTDPEMRVVRRLETQGRSAGYIRGWINACRGFNRLI